MKIVYVTQNYFPFVGGVETHVRQVAHELSRSHNVEIAAVNFQPYRGWRRLAQLHESVLAPHFDSYVDDGVPVHALTPTLAERLRMLPIAIRCAPRWQRYAYHGLRRFGYPWYRRVYEPKLRRILEGADVVHSHGFGYLGWATRFVTRNIGIPLVVTPYVHPHQWGDGPDDAAYYRQCDAVIGLVETDTEYLRTLGVPADRLHTIGVSPDLPATADGERFRRKHAINDAPMVLYIGRMMRQKGAESVLRGAELVWAKKPETRFVFIGPATPEEAQVFRDLDQRAIYLGKVSRQEKADALSACDVFCMPSMSEILPTVYLEAWSYGKPVVGGMARGLPELVQGNGAGLCVSQAPGDVAGSILQLLCDPDLRFTMGEQGRKLVNTKYSVSAVTSALLSVYTHVREVTVGRKQGHSD